MTLTDHLPPLRPLRAEYEEALGHALESLVATPSRRRRFRWRSSVVVGVSIGVAVAGGAAAAAYVEYQPVTNHASAHCYSLPSLSSNNGTTVVAVGPPGSPAQVSDALQTCSMLWQDGFLESGVAHIINVTGNSTLHPVPPLVVCTMPDAAAGVFPGDTRLCGRLGLPLDRPSTSAKSP